jgi:serine/threonine protein kinase
MHGDPDGADNFGFCLEHGRGVSQNIQIAADCYKFTLDHGHEGALVNYQRCLRLLGRWNPQNRSFDFRLSAPSRNDLADPLIASLDDPGQFDSENCELKASIEKLRNSRMTRPVLPALEKCVPHAVLPEPDCVEHVVAECMDGTFVMVKTTKNNEGVSVVERDRDIHTFLSHPLVVRVRGFAPHKSSLMPAIATEFVGRGRLTSQLPANNWNHIAKIVIGIVISMRYVHSRDVVHHDLTPHNIILDWDWSVRISGFGHSTSPRIDSTSASDKGLVSSLKNYRHTAPEYHENRSNWRSDVFSFGFILYELVVGRRVFRDDMSNDQIVALIVKQEFRPEIPDWVAIDVNVLMIDCWAQNPDDRPSFDEILDRLDKMKFKLHPDVNSLKLSAFVERLKELEAGHAMPEAVETGFQWPSFRFNHDGMVEYDIESKVQTVKETGDVSHT